MKGSFKMQKSQVLCHNDVMYCLQDSDGNQSGSNEELDIEEEVIIVVVNLHSLRSV